MGHYAKDSFSNKKGRFHASIIETNEEPLNKRAGESNNEQSP